MADYQEVRTKIIWLPGVFLYGAGFHFLPLQAVAGWAYAQSSNRSLIASPALNIGFPVAGGLCTLAAQVLLIKFVKRRVRRGFAIVVRAGVYGILATTATLHAVYLVVGLRLASSAASSARGGSFVLGFLLAMLDIETYGLFIVAFCAPFAFLYGMALALTAPAYSKRGT